MTESGENALLFWLGLLTVGLFLYDAGWLGRAFTLVCWAWFAFGFYRFVIVKDPPATQAERRAARRRFWGPWPRGSAWNRRRKPR